MDKLPFINKYGRITYCNDTQAFVRQKNYIVIKKDAAVLCGYNAVNDLFSLPSENEVEIDAEPTQTFTVLSYVYENGRPIKETQQYRLYDVENADLTDTPQLHWCQIRDIAVKKILFNATQLIGIKNVFVRMNKNEENI